MTYLELINNVLTRLREDKITEDQLNADNDTYVRYIGSAVNDAKRRVEDAWQWGIMRGSSTVQLSQNVTTSVLGNAAVALPGSANKNYVIRGITTRFEDTNNPFVPSKRSPMRQITQEFMDTKRLDPSNIPTGQPFEFSVTSRVEGKNAAFWDPSEAGNITITVFPSFTDESGVGDYRLEVLYVRPQDDLVNASDELFVPSLPVYTLAAALASRERGEVGGTPTNELLAIADSYLSDAIAYDSALYPIEVDWWSEDILHNTNVRFS